ncbi:MAG: hypothetical protein ETSY2_54840 [Candidatus Entotheonella gemina]|uniref:Uncharacterized protein n=1 Tax=Candidatus Entotheonella gemina TaxID=1429439 RepID=W4L1R1_9BACT|nr:MAG: hypothetical protein ETSY2_54840 [Candidatus Entotheonella gemina]
MSLFGRRNESNTSRDMEYDRKKLRKSTSVGLCFSVQSLQDQIRFIRISVLYNFIQN